MKRGIIVILVAVLVAVTSSTSAFAESPNQGKNTVGVSMSNGPTTSQGVAGFDPGGTQSSAASATYTVPVGRIDEATVAANAGSDLIVRQIPFNLVPVGAIDGGNGLIINNPGATRPACPAGQIGFFVGSANNNAAFQVVCVPNQAPAPPQATTVSPLQLAEEASAKQPWPDLLVSANPASGLTGLASWFWCAGNATMADASASAGPLTVTVHATLTDVTWRFGDGTAIAGDLGRAFPTPSDIQHVYETDSAHLEQGYQLIASVRWRVSFSVNGGPFSDLGIKTMDYTRTYLVEQLQPVAVRVP